MPTKKGMGGSSSAKSSARSTSSSASSSAPSKAAGTTGRGWGAVINQKKRSESRSGDNKPIYLDVKKKFYMTDGESVIVQILDAEPYCVVGCAMPPEHRDFYVSPKSVGKRHCPMIEQGLKEQWKATFRVLDYRGEWDKEKGDFKHDGKPVEKYWMVSQTVAQQLNGLAEKKGKPLNKMVLEVTRTGADKKTTYNFAPALDDDDMPYKPKVWEPKLPELEEAFKPLPEATLRSLLGLGDAGAADDEEADIDTE